MKLLATAVSTVSLFVQAASGLQWKWRLFTLMSGCLTLFVAAGACAQDASTKTPEQAIRSVQYDDWTWRCVVPSNGDANKNASPSCEIAQSVKVEQDGRPLEVLSLAVSRADDKAGKVEWALVVLTPLDVHLPSDFGLAAGSAKPATARFRNCNHLGCFVVMSLDQSLATKFRRASDGAVFFRLMNGKVVKVVFSLKGFSQAFDSLASDRLPPASVSNEGEGQK